jgi:hypothetical protein
MNVALMLLGAMLFPVAGFALLLWLTHLEETLPVAVDAARRKPAPPPILAVPVRRSVPEAQTVLVPEPRQAFSRSGAVSLGGSTKR